jgi:Flp pilus assembly pilin Flp
MNKPVQASLGNLLKRVHADERGAVALETILVVAAIAIPVILFIYKVAWPKIHTMFSEGIDDLTNQSKNIHSPGSP